MRLRMLTLNTWALPWPVSRDAPERVAAIAARLPEFGADVAVFQEVANGSARDLLVAAGLRAGLRHVWPARPQPHGGLLVLSSLPFQSSRFVRYRLNGLPERLLHGDYYLQKGFAQLSLASPVGPVALLVTHLHASYASSTSRLDYMGHRAAQVVELADAISQNAAPTIALGDFNFHEGTAHYFAFLGLSGMVDSAAALDRRELTIRFDNPYRHRGHRPGRRIDYAFVRDGEALALRPRRTWRVLDEVLDIGGQARRYSDHFGLLVEVEVGGPAPRPLRPPSEAVLRLARRLLEVGRRSAALRSSRARLWASGGAVACLTTLAARDSLVTRRGLLRTALWGVPALGLASSAGLASLAWGFVPDELTRYDAVEKILEKLRQSSAPPPRTTA